MLLFGKNVLFIAPQFFGYELDIISGLKDEGAIVDFLPDRPFLSPILRGITRIHRDFMIPYCDLFFKRSIPKFGKRNYDYIFIVVGEGVSANTINDLRSDYPNANFILYLWDALKNRAGLEKNLSLFDACFTFDPNDAELYGMDFRPLFFSPGFENATNVKLTYDLSFIGTAHSDRSSIVKAIQNSLGSNVLFYKYLYLQAPWVFYAHKIFNPSFAESSISEFRFSSLAKSVVQEVFFSSKAILDIEHPGQSGLTMRTFEALGSNKKMITTNHRIMDYDFYNPSNILVIDRHQHSHDVNDFLSGIPVAINPEIYNKYTLSGWIRETLMLT